MTNVVGICLGDIGEIMPLARLIINLDARICSIAN